MRSFPQLSLPIGGMRPRIIDFTSLLLSILVGIILAALTLRLGLFALPVVVFVLIVFPWLIQNPFKLYIWLIISWPTLALFVRVPLPAGIPDISYDRVLVLILMCVVVIEALLLRRHLLKTTILDLLILLYLAAQLSSRLVVLWFGGEGSPDLNGLLDTLLIPVGMYWITKNLLVSRSNIQWFLYALVIACLLICLTGLYEQAVGKRVFKSSISLGGTEERYIWQDVPGGRAAGAMGNPAVYGATLGIGILAGIGCLPHVDKKFPRVVLLASIGLLLYGVFASYTRSAWVSVFIVLFAVQFFINGLWKTTMPLFILGLLLLLLFWRELPGISIIENRALYANSLPVRFELINLGWDRFLERPIFGWGSGALNIFGIRQLGNTSHNIYLTFLVDGGVVLFLSFCIVVGYLLFRVIRVYGMIPKGGLERDALVSMTGSIFVFLLSGLALELRYFGYFNALFWICIGGIDSLGERCNRDG